MEFKLNGMGYYGGPGKRADFHCETTENFLNMPRALLIDGKVFKKHSFSVDNKTASYFAELSIQALSPDTSGTFEIIDQSSNEPPYCRRTSVSIY